MFLLKKLGFLKKTNGFGEKYNETKGTLEESQCLAKKKPMNGCRNRPSSQLTRPRTIRTRGRAQEREGRFSYGVVLPDGAHHPSRDLLIFALGFGPGANARPPKLTELDNSLPCFSARVMHDGRGRGADEWQRRR